MAMEKRFYRDPLELLIAVESRSCAGCVFVERAFGAAYCSKGKRYGRRCRLFSEVVKDGGR